MQADDRRLQERLQERLGWLRRMLPYVRPGRIVEYGCGSGFVLEFLAAESPGSVLVGIDRSVERLDAVVARRLSNVVPVRTDITRDIFPAGTFSSALFISVLHEIFSGYGEAGVVKVLSQARQALDAEGRVIIQDYLRPMPRSVEMSFKTEEARARFLRFAREFRPRRIEFKTTGSGVNLDIADAVEFLSKYHSQTEDDWAHEMDETHFFLTEEGFGDLAGTSGFSVEAVTRLPAGEHRLRAFGQNVALDLGLDYGWVQVVLHKA